MQASPLGASLRPPLPHPTSPMATPSVSGLGAGLVAAFLASLGQASSPPPSALPMPSGLTDLLTTYTESEEPLVREAALRQLVAGKPSISAAQADAVVSFARIAPTPEERALDLRTMSLFLTQRPSLPPAVIDDTRAYVGGAPSASERIERLRDVAGAFTDFPTVDADVFGRAVDDAAKGVDERDHRAHFEVSVPEHAARRILAHTPAATGPQQPPAEGSEMEIMARVSRDPALIAAWRATTLAEARCVSLGAEAALRGPDLVKAHPDLQSRFWADAYAGRAWLPLAGGLGVAVGGSVAAAFAGSMQATGLGIMGSIVAGFAVGVAANAFVARRVDHEVEGRIRQTLADTLEGWSTRQADLQRLQADARESALGRAWAEVAEARHQPPGEVTVGRDEVVIGGVVVGRRSRPSVP